MMSPRGPISYSKELLERMSRLTLSLRKRDKLLFGTVVVLLLYLLFGLLRLYPTALSLYLSFTNYRLIGGSSTRFTGLANYTMLLHDPSFVIALKNTLLIAGITVPTNLLLGLCLGLFFHTKWRLTSTFQYIYFMPLVMPTSALALIWKWMYEPQGLINYLLSLVGIKPIGWLTNPDAGVWGVVILWIWKYVGYTSILFYVGLENIPRMYEEAAAIDGANSWQIFRKITFPMLMPTTFFVCILVTTWAFQIFEPVYVMTTGCQGAFVRSVKVLVFDVYTNYFTYFKVGYASAEAMFLFTFLIAVALLQRRIMRRAEGGWGA